MSRRSYIIYDGRALFDVSSASIMDYLGEYTSLQAAIAAARPLWSGYDAVLVSYAINAEGLQGENVEGDLGDL
jgi:hypothetical protein